MIRHAHRGSGFTLIEVLVSAALCTFIIAGVLGAFLWLGRGGFAASSYSELEAETRRALEIFGEEARKTAEVRWHSSQSITLWVATATNITTPVTYAYDSDPGSPTHQCFYRLEGEATSPGPRRILVRNVAPNLEFRRFKLERPGIEDNAATNDLETKQIEVAFRASRTAVTAIASTQSALSARYVLRNKRVSN
jgi:hypothetical protein